MKSVMFIPVFNQIRELPTVLDELAAVALPVDTILLVNNGSSDGSEQLVRKSGYPHLDLARNRGVGFSQMRAIEWALEHGYEAFGAMASNGKMLPSEMNRVMGPVIADAADYVTGSRFLPGGSSPNLTPFRAATIPIVNIYVKCLTGVRLTDATCGYNGYRLDLIRRARFDWRKPSLFTYGFEYYLYAKCLLDRSVRCLEVPVTMRYPSEGPVSKIKPFKGWYDMLKPWVMARLDGDGFAPRT